MNPPSLAPYVWMLFGAAAFAVMGNLAYALRSYCDWQVVALARSSLALVLASVAAWAAGARLVFFRPRTLWLRSISGSVALVCTFFALARLPVSDVLAITNTFPLWVALFSWPMLGQRPSAGVWVAVLCGLVGVALIEQPHVAVGDVAALLALVSSLASALAMIGLHRLHAIDYRAVVVHFSAVSSLFCLAAWALLPTHPHGGQIAAGAWAMLLGMGAAATTGQMLLTKALAAGPPAKVSVVALTQVGFGVFLDALLWKRTFAPTTILGIVLVIAPTAWVMWRRGPAASDEMPPDALAE